tara:strand:- start:162 stop:908 length:747 start_codon:yes stop_codon:yes gene_type:complete
MMRDSQRSKVYAWERQASWGERTNNELDDTQVLHIVKELDRKLKRKQKTTIVFTNRHANATAQNWGNIITIPRKWARCWSVVLHEYAHLLTPAEQHGPVFVSTFCVLLKNFHPAKPTFKELSADLRERSIDFKSLQDNKYEKKCKRLTITTEGAKKYKHQDFLENTVVWVGSKGFKKNHTKYKRTRVTVMVEKIIEYVRYEKRYTELGVYSKVKAKDLYDNVEGLTISDLKYFIETGKLMSNKSCLEG